MSVWDYIMPHRLLLNKSLRRASQELRDRIDAYQIEYDRRIDECKTELFAAEAEKNRQLEEFRVALIQELNSEKRILDDIQEDIMQYTDCFFQRSYLYRLRDIKKKQNDILYEDYAFLTEQIKSIDREIKLLRERQNELTSFTAVNDIIELQGLCGYDLNFNTNDNAKTLLTKISNALDSYQGSDSAEKFALLRLKTIIQERSDYLPTIDYIAWVIQIKIKFKKQLQIQRSYVKDQQTAIRNDLSNIRDEINSYADSLAYLAAKVRYHWARPITYINVDICYAYIELKENRIRLLKEAPALRDELKDKKRRKSEAIDEIRDKKRKRRDVGSEIRDMRDSHSSDEWRWNHLQREGRDLTSEIDSLSSDIDNLSSDIRSLVSELDSLQSAVRSSESTISSKKSERKEWAARRTRIVNLIKSYDKAFRSDRRISESDEIDILDTRISEIQVIREEGRTEAEKVYERERDALITEHEHAIQGLNLRNKELQQELDSAERTYQHCSDAVTEASRNLKKCQEANKRFILFKAFSEAPEVTAAQKVLENAKASLSRATAEKEAIRTKISALQGEIKEENDSFQINIKRCQPNYLRPTSDEILEEKKLLARRDEIEQQRSGGNYAGKN